MRVRFRGGPKHFGGGAVMRPPKSDHEAHAFIRESLFFPRTNRPHEPRLIDAQKALVRERHQEGDGGGYHGDRRLLGEDRPGLARHAGDTVFHEIVVAGHPAALRDGHLTGVRLRRHRERI